MSTPQNITDNYASRRCLRLRHQIELLGLRSEMLNSEDKALVQLVFEKGSTFHQIARLTGQNASTISRRFHNLSQKLIARELIILLRQQKDFDKFDICIVQEYYLRGQSQKAIAQKLCISLYRVRRTLSTLRSIIYRQQTLQSQHTKRNRKHFLSKQGAIHAYSKS